MLWFPHWANLLRISPMHSPFGSMKDAMLSKCAEPLWVWSCVPRVHHLNRWALQICQSAWCEDSWDSSWSLARAQHSMEAVIKLLRERWMSLHSWLYTWCSNLCSIWTGLPRSTGISLHLWRDLATAWIATSQMMQKLLNLSCLWPAVDVNNVCIRASQPNSLRGQRRKITALGLWSISL